MLIHIESFSNVSGLGPLHHTLWPRPQKIFGPRPRPHSFWPRPHAQLASLTSLQGSRGITGSVNNIAQKYNYYYQL